MNIPLRPLSEPSFGDVGGSAIRLTAVSCHRLNREHDHHTLLRLALLDAQVSTSDQHGDFTIQERNPVSILDASRGRSLIILQASIFFFFFFFLWVREVALRPTLRRGRCPIIWHDLFSRTLPTITRRNLV